MGLRDLGRRLVKRVVGAALAPMHAEERTEERTKSRAEPELAPEPVSAPEPQPKSTEGAEQPEAVAADASYCVRHPHIVPCPAMGCPLCSQELKPKAQPKAEEPAGLKVCNTCGEELPFSAFYKMKRYPDGLRPRCKRCEKRARDPEPAPPKLPEIVPEGTKRCSACDKLKPIDAFYVDRQKADGRRSSCRDCDRKRQPAPKPRPKAGEARCKICREILPLESFPLDGDERSSACARFSCQDELHRRRIRQLKSAAARAARRAEAQRRERERAALTALKAGHKECSRCEEDKPLQDYPLRPAAPDGRSSVCSTCIQRKRGSVAPEDVERVRRWEARQLEMKELVAQSQSQKGAKS